MTVPSIFRHPFLLRHVVRYPRIFWLGFKEAFDNEGYTYYDDPWHPKSMAYDCGRDLRRLGSV
jgi:hypothetical protein